MVFFFFLKSKSRGFKVISVKQKPDNRVCRRLQRQCGFACSRQVRVAEQLPNTVLAPHIVSRNLLQVPPLHLILCDHKRSPWLVYILDLEYFCSSSSILTINRRGIATL